MSGKKTLAIIKPDAVQNGHIGKIIDHLLAKGIKINAMRLMHLSTAQAAAFYAVHRERPFFNDLVVYMTSGPCIPMALELDNAVLAFREIIGATNPEQAANGTIRKLYGQSLEKNAIHGSDSDENAAREINFFFSGIDHV
ncbi:MAG: nucleoside-diphosphate kinase [Bacteroidia bacterium]|nr:nucleoside-diphosphate kinase [Bacteroidia bacterium]